MFGKQGLDLLHKMYIELEAVRERAPVDGDSAPKDPPGPTPPLDPPKENSAPATEVPPPAVKDENSDDGQDETTGTTETKEGGEKKTHNSESNLIRNDPITPSPQPPKDG